jgi:hypothetical protein
MASNIVGLVINPITWTRTESAATIAGGLGSIMPDSVTLKFQPVPQYPDAVDSAQIAVEFWEEKDKFFVLHSR